MLKWLLSVALLVCVSAPHLRASDDRPEFHIRRAEKPPTIDGSLNEDIWQDDPLVLGDWLSYDPLYGQKMEQKTEVRAAYDDRYLYFSFHCIDAEPDKIRTTISKRDNIFNDDWVGLSLDSAGNAQTSYHMMVNPSGIQMDALNTAASGESWEADWIWDSAGKLTEDGYSVEIRLPLQSIRFKGGDEVKMGILFWRRISRLGVSSSWPDIPPGQWVFNRHAHLVFENLKQPPLLELLPSATYSVNQLRATPDRWNKSTQKGSLGFSAKYGITSSIILDATVNPDFSQVESDAFQVQVNQRFPIFFSEKRPFFMEGMGLFNLAGSGGDGNMVTGVHTRRIVDPSFGSKLTGSAGRVTFGMLTASDQTPEDIGNRGEAVAGKSKMFTVGRALYALGASNYVGAIVSDTEHVGRYNRVVGADTSIRFAGKQQINATFLSSGTGISLGPKTSGVAAQVTYSYDTRNFRIQSQTEHYDKEFQMDTSFYNQTGFTSNWTYAEINRYPKNNGSWLKRATFFTWNKEGRDRLQRGNLNTNMVGFRMNLTRQGFFRVDTSTGREPWAGQRFKSGRTRVMGNMQIKRWLYVNAQFNKGWATYYDSVRPFQGRSTSRNYSVTLQPNSRFNENISYNNVRFRRESTDEEVFDVRIVNLRSTYQFDKHFFVRATIQYDSSQSLVLTDFLASYELVPGSVMHAGYGSLIERRTLQDGTFVPGGDHYLTLSRGLFFKVSYLHRF